VGPAESKANGRFSGAARVVFGFVIGAVFTLVPVYYYNQGKEAALRDSLNAYPPSEQTFTPTLVDAGQPSPARGAAKGQKPFASRLTYELSRLPEEPIAAVARVPIPAPPAPRAEESPAERVSNARPISAIPPDTRDRTREIEKEARKPEYREPPRQQAVPAAPPRVFEGREVELKAQKLPDTPTRPIVAGGSVNTRAEIEAERSRLTAEVARAWPTSPAPDASARKGEARTVIATAPVTGATPITRAPETRAEPDTTKAASASAQANVSFSGPATVEGRLSATREWLAAVPQTTHTIQLMGTNSEEQLRANLKALSKTLEPGKIFVFRTVAQGKPSITVVYGSYADRAAALQALGKLPATVAANKPVLRTVNGIRAEMKQHKTDTQS